MWIIHADGGVKQPINCIYQAIYGILCAAHTHTHLRKIEWIPRRAEMTFSSFKFEFQQVKGKQPFLFLSTCYLQKKISDKSEYVCWCKSLCFRRFLCLEKDISTIFCFFFRMSAGFQ